MGIREQKFLTLPQAARLAPSQPHPSALWRWARKGLRTRGGTRLHLRTARSGRTLFTTEEWLWEFIENLAEADREAWTPSHNRDRAPDTAPGERNPEKRAQAVTAARTEFRVKT